MGCDDPFDLGLNIILIMMIKIKNICSNFNEVYNYYYINFKGKRDV